jgi:hypothetical protein
MFTVIRSESDLYSVYITDDQKNFRKYIGVCDERNEKIDFRCNGTYIISTKTSSEGLDTYWIAPKIVEQKKFNLKELKDSHQFDL